MFLTLTSSLKLPKLIWFPLYDAALQPISSPQIVEFLRLASQRLRESSFFAERFSERQQAPIASPRIDILKIQFVV